MVSQLLDPERFRLLKLEDGEEVIRLRGASKRAGESAAHRSDLPHAGKWGDSTGYLLVPSGSAVHRRTRALRAFFHAISAEVGIDYRSSDAEVLIVGPFEAIERAITEGPPFCRAQMRRRASTAQKERLAAYAFKKQDPASAP